jgi:hypothetical protein
MTRVRLGLGARASVWTTLGALVLAGCDPYPGADGRFDDDVIATAFDQGVDFTQFKTFAVDPTVHLVRGSSEGGYEKRSLPDAQAQAIVQRVVKNMTALGYVQVKNDQDPDLGITLTGIDALVSGTVSGWWGYGGYWGYGGWGYYYPYSYAYSYRTGSLVTEMVDLTRMEPPLADAGSSEVVDAGGIFDPSEALPVVWNAVAYQVLDRDGVPDVGWAKKSIDQAFEQSPRLGRK